MKIEFKQKNKNGTEAIVYDNEENKLEAIVFVGKAPRISKMYVVPKDKLKEALQQIFEGKPVPKYEEKMKP